MLRRKPTKIQVKIEDKEELEESRKPTITTTTTSSSTTATSTSSLLHLLDHSKPNPSSKSNRIGLSP
jgi:hypothetical protein